MVRELVREQNNGIQVIMRLYQKLFCFNRVERIVMACNHFQNRTAPNLTHTILNYITTILSHIAKIKLTSINTLYWNIWNTSD